jgi:hypothetical protein
LRPPFDPCFRCRISQPYRDNEASASVFLILHPSKGAETNN